MKRGIYLSIGLSVTTPDGETTEWMRKIIHDIRSAIQANWGNCAKVKRAMRGMNIRTKTGIVWIVVFVARPTNVDSIDVDATVSQMDALVRTVLSQPVFKSLEIDARPVKHVSRFEALRRV